jgi:hypothetical protein
LTTVLPPIFSNRVSALVELYLIKDVNLAKVLNLLGDLI